MDCLVLYLWNSVISKNIQLGVLKCMIKYMTFSITLDVKQNYRCVKQSYTLFFNMPEGWCL